MHRLAPGEGLVLLGVHVACPLRLLGHSDADVGLHALTDALLGALGAGDIGSHFPPTERALGGRRFGAFPRLTPVTWWRRRAGASSTSTSP